MVKFAGKVALITGGSRGIGKATAILFAKLGGTAVINYVSNATAAKQVVDEIESFDGKAMSVACDVSDLTQVKKMVAKILGQLGGIDILVNNAGVWLPSPIQQFDFAAYERTLAINLTGSVTCCTAVVPGMIEQGGGRIINVASTAGQRGEAGYSPYAASKGAIISFTKSLAAELAAHNVLVNCVAPGWVDTDMSEEAIQREGENILSTIPLRRVATPEEIAWPILFLASAGASYITGEIFNVNGGSVLCG